jgi:hypothetical protein
LHSKDSEVSTIENAKFWDESTALIRLTALWALNEAALGGLMHLFRSPFTGIFVGGNAILLIALIAHVSKRPAVAIVRALLLVLLIKGMASPHSPLPAYVAVSFQGLLGALLFTIIPSFRLAALLTGCLALVEAAVQKVLVMTILFGMPLWRSIDAFVDHVLRQFGILAEGSSAKGSWWIVGLYIGLYFLSGLAIGWLAGRLPGKVEAAAQRLSLPAAAPAEGEGGGSPNGAKPFWKKRPFRWTVLTLAFLLAVYFLVPGTQQALAPAWLLLRVAGLLALWYFLVSPVLMRLLQGFLRRRAADRQQEVEAAMSLLPAFRRLSRAAWSETRHLKGWRRWQELVVRIIAYALMYAPAKR